MKINEKLVFWIAIAVLSIAIFSSCTSNGEKISQKEKDSIDAIENANRLNAEKEENLRKDSLAFYENLANDLLEKKKFTKAIEEFSKAIEFAKKEESSVLIMGRASAYFSVNKLKEAVVDYSSLINANTSKSVCYYERARCYLKMGKKKDGIEDLRSSMNLGNDDSKNLYEKVNPLKKRVAYYVTRCCDGSTSNAKGRGACSHHGGVCNWNDPVYEEYREF